MEQRSRLRPPRPPRKSGQAWSRGPAEPPAPFQRARGAEGAASRRGPPGGAARRRQVRGGARALARAARRAWRGGLGRARGARGCPLPFLATCFGSRGLHDPPSRVATVTKRRPRSPDRRRLCGLGAPSPGVGSAARGGVHRSGCVAVSRPCFAPKRACPPRRHALPRAHALAPRDRGLGTESAPGSPRCGTAASCGIRRVVNGNGQVWGFFSVA